MKFSSEKINIVKKILVPTDFSPVADNAIEHAIGIAAAFQSELFLYHVYAINKVDYNLSLPAEEQPMRKLSERKMRLTESKYSKAFAQEGLSVKTVVEEDSIFTLFKRKAKEHQISLIVMGSKGATGLKRVIFGSVAAAALQMARVPVLVVPPDHTFRPLQHIVLAIDHEELTTDGLLPLQKLATKFGAKVTLLYVNAGATNKSHQQIASCLAGVETTYREVPLINSINESTNEFVKDQDCDLLCMVRRERGFFESFFKKSITAEQVYNSDIPLLVLPDLS